MEGNELGCSARTATKRVVIVYGLGSGFLCRHCYDLPYSSQNEGYLERMRRKAEKISKRLESETGKPKGMHWHTYNTLRMQEGQYNYMADVALEGLLNKLQYNLRQ